MLNCLDELYSITDDFCKEYEKNIKKRALGNARKKTRNRKYKLSLSQIVTIIILYQTSNIKNFKAFYMFLTREMKGLFPTACSYQRFVELAPIAMMPLMLMLNCLYASCDGKSIVDSTTIKVCHIKREKRHKTFKGIAVKSKGTMGWFYGFKLHIITNLKGELLNAHFSYANIDDRKGLINMCKKIFGDVIADKGYIGKEFKQSLKSQGINLITRGKKNMKEHKLTAREQALINTRNLVETVIGKLKLQCNLEHTRHKSMNGLMLNILSTLVAYCLMVKKPKISVNYAKNLNKPLLAIA